MVACPHPANPFPDVPRAIVVSHPYPPDGGSRDDRYEVLRLEPDGGIIDTGQVFRMRRTGTPDSLISFVPSGRLGFVAQDDGTVGIFRLDAQGFVTVVDPAYQAGFYASTVYSDPTGAYLYVVDFNTINNGGGVHRVALACDGTPTTEGKVLTGNTPSKLAWLHAPAADRAVIAATSLGASAATDSVHLVALTPASATVLGSVAAFPLSDAISSHVAVSSDDQWVAVSDNGLFAGSRVALLSYSGGVLTPTTVVAVPNPLGVAWSPYEASGLVVSSDGADHFRALLRDGGVSGPLPYTFGRPQLPGPPIVIERGELRGRVLIAELDAIRQVQFRPDGGITDVAKFVLSGTGSGKTIGTFGVAP